MSVNKETDLKFTSFATDERSENEYRPKLVCKACSGPHRIWKCESFKKNDYKAKHKIILQNGLCNKCLERGHIARNCPKLHFKCQEFGCGQPHHTLMHRPRKENAKSSQTQTGAGEDKGTTAKEVSSDQGSFGTATRHNRGNRVSLGAVLVKIRAIDGAEEIQTYALLDNGSEVTL